MTSDDKTNNDGLIDPGTTATGSGTSMGESAENDGLGGVDPLEAGTTEADVSDGSEQKLHRMD